MIYLKQNKKVYSSKTKVSTTIFLFIRGRTIAPQTGNGDIAEITPEPPPTFYEILFQDIQEQEGKVIEIGNDLRELDIFFSYQSVNFSDVLSPAPTQAQGFGSQKAEVARARAELEIDRRVAILESLIPRIEATEKTSPIQKALYASEVESQINFLNSLKARVIDRVSFDQLSIDINVLSDNYNNFRIIASQVLIVVIADKINVSGESFTGIAIEMGQKIEELRVEKKDVLEAQKNLGNILFVLGDALAKAETAVVEVLPLTSAQGNYNSVLLSAKATVGASHKNLNIAVRDGRNLINSLMDIEAGRTQRPNFFQFFPLFSL